MYVVIEVFRQEGSPEDCRGARTVGELREYLSNFSDDTKVVGENDGYYSNIYVKEVYP